jgi:hypothetical protein
VYGIALVAGTGLLIPQWGILGGAVSASCALTGVNVLRVWQVWQSHRMFPWTWSILKPLSAGAVMGFVLIVAKSYAGAAAVRARGGEESLGLLKVLRSAPARWASVESQTALACVLPIATEPATGPVPSTARRRAATECGVARGFYARYVIRRATIPDPQCAGRRRTGRLGDGD